MMAGTGVSVGGAGMLRARRRDVSVKPNRKLDRKSSRGMIYENEELRLRTININAEVEQGQNDIKKLRRENELLRREIWSLRDEYDKLEEILKCQKNREDSEDYEDRSEAEEKDDDDEAEECSDYSGEEIEEAEEDCDEEEKDESENYEAEVDNESGNNQEERLENAENQKISSEKMSISNHRLHVEFDDLSVVDEEEELKKDRERKESVVSSEEREGTMKITKEADLVRMNSRNGYRCFPPRYGSSPGTSGSADPYYPDRPFAYANSDGTEFTGVLPIDQSSMLLARCPGLYDDPFGPIGSYEPPGVANVPPGYNENPRRDQMTYGNQVGWQSNVLAPSIGFQTSESYEADLTAAKIGGMCQASMFNSPGQSDHSNRTASTARATSLPHGTSFDDRTDSYGRIPERFSDNAVFPNLFQRRNLPPRQPNNFHGDTIISSRVGAPEIEGSTSTEVLTRNGWDFGNAKMFRDSYDRKNAKEEHGDRREAGEVGREPEGRRRLEDSTTSAVGSDRPKHFFAPLLPKIQHTRQDSSDKTSTRTTNPGDSPSATFFENFGTGKSSGSDRTNSTVISARNFQPHGQPPPTLMEFFADSGEEKGSADICVNGGVAAYSQSDHRTNEARSYKSSDNLLIGDASRGNSSSRQGSNNPLVKSVSCQDLSSEQLQNSLFEMTRTFQADGKTQKFAKSDNTLDNPVIVSSKPFRSQLNVTLKFPCNASSSGKENGRYTPETPEIPKLPTIDYRLFNNPFLKTFDSRFEVYGNYDYRFTRPLSIQVNESSLERGKMLHQQPSIDYSSAVLTQSFARRLNPDESTVKSTRTYSSNEMESERRRVSVSSATTNQVPAIDPRIIGNPKQRQEFQVTSFEAPNPRSLHTGLTAYDIDSLRALPAQASTVNALITNHPNLYQNVPFVPGTPGMFCSSARNAVRMFYENQTQKVPAQTQTSIDGGSNHENETTELITKSMKISDTENRSVPGSPTSSRRKRVVRKERVSQKTDKRPLSPAAQRRRLRKQSSSIDNVDCATEQNKIVNKTRQLSPSMTNTTTTTTTSEHLEEKNESRSSSSGQESPRKERNRRVSMYFNSKKRPSIASAKTTRSFSIDNTKDNFVARTGGETVETTNSERERTNSASSREVTSGKARKSSVSSGKLPWCACWGNGCV